MTETTQHVSKGTSWLLLLLVATVVVLGAWVASNRHEQEVRRGCMERLVEPDPKAPDYHEQALLFGSEVRGCMRG